MGDVEKRVAEAIFEAAPKLKPLVLKDPNASLEGLHDPEELARFLAEALTGLTWGILLTAREIDVLRAEIDSHRS